MSNFTSNNTSFIVKNVDSLQRTIKIFAIRLGFGNTLDLVKIPGIGLDDIQNSLLKGDLGEKLDNGTIIIVKSDLNNNPNENLDYQETLFNAGAATAWHHQENWYIDALNGDDENKGDSETAPIKHHKTMVKRIGDKEISQLTTVNLINNFGDDNPVHIRFNLGNGGVLFYKGRATTLYSGVIGSVVEVDRDNNIPNSFTDTSITGGSWTDSGYVNTSSSEEFRLKLVSGSNAGAISWTLKDLGSHEVRTGAWTALSTDYPAVFPPVAVVQPSPGDHYVIESLTKISDFCIDVRLSGVAPQFGFASSVLLTDIAVSPGSFDDPISRQPYCNVVGQGIFPAVHFEGCSAGLKQRTGDTVSFNNCKFAGGIFSNMAIISAFLWFNACVVLVDRLECGSGGSFSGYWDTTFQSCDIVLLPGGFAGFGSAGIFDSPGAAGLTVLGGCTVITVPFNDNGEALYGSGSDSTGSIGFGVGVNLAPGSHLLYTNNIPTITGPTTDANIGGFLKTWAEVPFTSSTLAQIVHNSTLG